MLMLAKLFPNKGCSLGRIPVSRSKGLAIAEFFNHGDLTRVFGIFWRAAVRARARKVRPIEFRSSTTC